MYFNYIYHILGVVKKIHYFPIYAKIMDFFLLHLIYIKLETIRNIKVFLNR